MLGNFILFHFSCTSRRWARGVNPRSPFVTKGVNLFPRPSVIKMVWFIVCRGFLEDQANGS